MQLSQRQKKLLRWVGYPLLALITFVFVVHLTFPYERVVERFVVEPLQGKYQVTYLSVDRGILPGSVTINGLSLSSLDTGDDNDADKNEGDDDDGEGDDEADGDDGGTNLYFKEVSLDLGLFDLIRGRADVEFAARLGDGSISGHVEASRAELQTTVNASSLPLNAIGGVRTAVGLPMEGGLDMSIDLTMPNYRWDKMNGEITLACLGCTIGDGKTKIKPRAPPGRRIARNTMLFAGDGLTVPRLALGNLSGTMTIEDGRGSIDDFMAESDDGDMALQAVVRFTKTIGQSRFESGCMKFRLSDSLKEREKEFGNLPTFMKISPEPDGFSNVKLQGLVKAMRWIPTRKCGAGGDDEDDERVARPRVTRPQATTPETMPPKPLTPGLTPGLTATGQEEPTDEGTADGTLTVPDPRSSGPPLARPPKISDDVGGGEPGTLQAVPGNGEDDGSDDEVHPEDERRPDDEVRPDDEFEDSDGEGRDDGRETDEVEDEQGQRDDNNFENIE